MSVRAATRGDITAIGSIAETTGLFPAEYLSDMIAPGLSGSPDLWRVSEAGDAVTGFAFARPEEMADNVWNLLALAVTDAARGTGASAALLAEIEEAAQARMIVIETTQLAGQSAARAFYEKSGYTEEGRVRDFYSTGEDKVIFRKVTA